MSITYDSQMIQDKRRYRLRYFDVRNFQKWAPIRMDACFEWTELGRSPWNEIIDVSALHSVKLTVKIENSEIA